MAAHHLSPILALDLISNHEMTLIQMGAFARDAVVKGESWETYTGEVGLLVWESMCLVPGTSMPLEESSTAFENSNAQ